MKTRIIYTKIWKDEYFASLTQKEKLFFMYLLTNERVNICGIYELSDREMMFDTGYPIDTVSSMKDRLSKDGKFYFYKGWVKIVNYDKYNGYSGEKTNVCKEKDLELAPNEIKEMDTPSIHDQYPIDTPNNNIYINNNKLIINNINNKQEIIKFFNAVIEENEYYQEILESLKEKIPKEILKIELKKFCNYWTEKNQSGTKERWQLEKTFEVKKRLTTWFNNIKSYQKVGGNYDRDFDRQN